MNDNMSFELKEKAIERYNEEIIQRAEQIFEKYVEAGYSETFALERKEAYINQYKQ